MKAEFAGKRPPGGTMEDVLREFEPLLQGVATVARGNELYGADIEAMFPFLEENGWRLTSAVRRIWDGERDLFSLMYGLDLQDSLLIKRILELLEEPAPADSLASLPPAVQAAVAAGDVQAINEALAELPPAEAQAIVRQLLDSGIVSRPETEPIAAEEVEEAVLPPAVLAALEAEDLEALQAALDELPAAEAQAVLDRLQEAGVIGLSAAAGGKLDMDEVLRRFEPLLRSIADVAVSDQPAGQLQTEIEAILLQLEANGWHLTAAARQIWDGERDVAVLTAALDEKNSQLVRRILAYISE